jgi:riboflavin-specific deaminase-like protein
VKARGERPHVSVNFAITWDGRITTRTRPGVNFSSKLDKRRLLEIRAAADAVMVSARTAAADHMTMGMPVAELRAKRVARGLAEYPLRVLLSNSGRIDPELPVFQKDISPIVIFSTARMPRRLQAELGTKAGLRLSVEGNVDLREMLRVLRKEYGVRRLHCEGGGEVFRSLLQADAVDEIFLTMCPRIFGGVKTPTLTGMPGDFLPRSVRAELKTMEVVEGEAFLRYRVRRDAGPR